MLETTSKSAATSFPLATPMDYSGYGQSSWDGSLVSLNSSTYSVRPSSPSSAHDSSPDPTSVPLAPRPLVPSPSTAHSLSNSSASLHPASPASAPPSPPHTTASAPPPIPSLPPSRPGPLPTDAPHPLASFLLASLSPPTSPTSLASFPASRSESIEPGSPHSRGRSSTGGSGRGREGELVMPSMRLGNAGRGERREGARVVLAGKTVEERRGLARLLGEEGDMTGSFASARLSERSTVSGGQEAMFEELKYATRTMAFYHPANGVEVDALAAALLVSLEKMEAILDSTYPTTQTLANLVTEATRDDFEACFFLFSSRAQFYPLLPDLQLTCDHCSSHPIRSRRSSHDLAAPPPLPCPPPPAPANFEAAEDRRPRSRRLAATHERRRALDFSIRNARGRKALADLRAPERGLRTSRRRRIERHVVPRFISRAPSPVSLLLGSLRLTRPAVRRSRTPAIAREDFVGKGANQEEQDDRIPGVEGD